MPPYSEDSPRIQKIAPYSEDSPPVLRRYPCTQKIRSQAPFMPTYAGYG